MICAWQVVSHQDGRRSPVAFCDKPEFERQVKALLEIGKEAEAEQFALSIEDYVLVLGYWKGEESKFEFAMVPMISVGHFIGVLDYETV